MSKGKLLVVLTNVAHYENDEEKTGLWLAEATEFVDVVTQAGFEVDYVSPKGGQVPIDPRSLKKFYTTSRDLEIFNSSDFQQRALTNSLQSSEITSDSYLAIYYTGGHGVIWDFPDDIYLQKAAQSIYQSGGFVTSVCHGVAGLLNIQGDNGQLLIDGKNITGFTQMEEILSGKSKKVPYQTEGEAKKRGAKFHKRFPFMSYALRDGRVITGQNPMSGRAVARLLVEALS